MESLELPVLEQEAEETAPLDQPVDLAAFQLWKEASCIETDVQEETANTES